MSNALVNRAGTTFLFRLGDETGARRRTTSHAPSPSHARSSASGACGRRSRRSTGESPRRRSSRCCSRRGSCWSARPAGSCGTARARSTSPRRSRASRAGAAALAAACPTCSAPSEETRPGRAAAGVRRRRAFRPTLAQRVATPRVASSRPRSRRDRSGGRGRRGSRGRASTSRSASGSSCTGCASGSSICLARRAGRQWRVQRCGTTSTPSRRV